MNEEDNQVIQRRKILTDCLSGVDRYRKPFVLVIQRIRMDENHRVGVGASAPSHERVERFEPQPCEVAHPSSDDGKTMYQGRRRDQRVLDQLVGLAMHKLRPAAEYALTGCGNSD